VDCNEFDGQVVRLENIKDIADEFVLTRLTEIESLNLKVFDFDYDLTFMVFFMSADEKILSRYGGRCEKGPDGRQSLAGLRYTMQSVLAEWKSQAPRFAQSDGGKPFYIREIAPPRGLGRCIHCHQAKEVIYDRLDRDGKWNIDLAFRYPLPENLGLQLDVDRSNVVKEVKPDTPAAKTGINPGDVITSLNQIAIHSEGDVRYSLDQSPKSGSIPVTWTRNNKPMSGSIDLPDRWRRTDISWRPSLQNFVATARIFGKDLESNERKELGLSDQQLAFRQKSDVPESAKKAGIREGDIILGFDDLKLEMTAYDFLLYVRSNYVKGETVKVNVLRGSKKLRLRMTLD
jgi:serine protease Do